MFNGVIPIDKYGIRILDKSDALDMLGYGGHEVVWAVKHAIVDGIYNHDLTADDWKKVPEWIENPVAVFKHDDGHITIVAPELKNGQPIIIELKPKLGAQGDRRKKLHVVLTAFNKNKGKLPIARMIQEGNLLYINTRKSPAFNRGSRHLLPISTDEFRGSKHKIYNVASNFGSKRNY